LNNIIYRYLSIIVAKMRITIINNQIVINKDIISELKPEVIFK